MVAPIDSPSQLVDIVPPAIPLAAEPNSIWMVMTLVAAITLLMWFSWRWYRSERLRSLRRLSCLYTALQAQELSSREVAYWLAAFLRWRLRTNYLSPGVPLPIVSKYDQRRWDSFMQRLHVARYAPYSEASPEIVLLLKEAEYWLRRWP